MPMQYFQVNGHNILHGTMRKIDPVLGWVWVKLLAMCSQSRVWGVICANDEAPYDDEYLAFMCGVSVEEYIKARDYHIQEKRITINEWGGIVVINWDEYQNSGYARVAKTRAKKKKKRVTSVTKPVTDETEGVTVETKCNKSIEEKRIEPKRKELNKPKVLKPTSVSPDPVISAKKPQPKLKPETKKRLETRRIELLDPLTMRMNKPAVGQTLRILADVTSPETLRVFKTLLEADTNGNMKINPLCIVGECLTKDKPAAFLEATLRSGGLQYEPTDAALRWKEAAVVGKEKS